MNESEPREPVVTTGRPIDGDGKPTDGPALELDPTGPAGSLFAASSRPLVSDPTGPTWATLLERPEEGATDRPVLLQWVGADAPEPPTHVHPATETFEAVAGETTVVVEGEPVRLAPGESVTVDPGREHTFRNDTDDTVAFRAELPSMRTVEGLFTVWGATHEAGGDGGYGRPSPVRALLASEDLHGETTVTVAPVAIQRILWATVGRVARTAGYVGVEDRYLEDEFWERHVEQPPTGGPR